MNAAFLPINEVSKQLDIPAYTLRYWEKQFPTAIKPATGAGGRRYYRPETVAQIVRIRELLYDRGMTIAGAKKALKNSGAEDCFYTHSIRDSAAMRPAGASRPGGAEPEKNLINPNAEIGACQEKYSKIIELLELAKAELQ